MENITDICREILCDFLDRWSVDEVKRMTLDQYVSIGDKDTFCQWLETRTRILGSIKGVPSFKFGIYKLQLADKLSALRLFPTKSKDVASSRRHQREIIR